MRVLKRTPIIAAGLGLLACAVCCALPILGALGLSGGLMAASLYVEPLALGLLAVAAATLVVWLVRRRQSGGGCGPAGGGSCAAGGGCGCAPGG